jgi:hypothetical protein
LCADPGRVFDAMTDLQSDRPAADLVGDRPQLDSSAADIVVVPTDGSLSDLAPPPSDLLPDVTLPDLGSDVSIPPVTYSTYDISQEQPISFVDACALPNATFFSSSDRDDGADVMQPIGFPFTLYSLQVSSLAVTINGGLLLDPGAPPEDANPQHGGLCFPSSEGYPSTIAVLRTDLILRTTSQICWVTVGSSPTRQFVATWKDLNYYFDPGSPDPGAHLTFTVILNEEDQSIEMLYEALQGGTDRAAVGVQNADFSAGTVYTCDDAALQAPLSRGMHLRFKPVP